MKFIFTLFFIVSVAVGAQRIAITFDDFPMGPTLLHEKEQRVALYLEKLDRLGIQTVFFCVGSQLDSPLSDRCLEMAAAHNQLLANHSFSHPH